MIDARNVARLARRLAAPLMLAAACQANAAIEQLVTLPTRDGVTERYLLVTADAAPKKAVLVSFVGSAGNIDLARRMDAGVAQFGPSANFLIRIRDLLVTSDIADAIVDAPSDRHAAGGLTDAFRKGPEHAADIRGVIADLVRRYPGARIYLAGTSRGAISAAALGVALRADIAGVILSSTVTQADKSGPGLSQFDWSTLTVPTLVIHHVDDACRSSPYSGAVALSNRYPLVSVRGGDAPRSGPCDPLAAHGYLGVEAPVVAVMQQFMLGQPYAHTIP